MVLVVLIVWIIPKNDTKSAGWYLDRQIELENQIKVLKVEWEEVKAKKDEIYVKEINKGLVEETSQPVKSETITLT